MHIWHHKETPDVMDNRHAKDIYSLITKGVYVDITQLQKRYAFHQTELSHNNDKQNLCVSCHGDIPHNKNKATRAFLNMHSFFLGCEVCHIKIKNKDEWRFKWYDKVSGKISDTIDTGVYLGDTQYKLTLVDRNNKNIYSTDEIINFVKAFREKERDMLPAVKSAAIQSIHKPMDNVTQSLKCNECHSANINEVYLPLKEIGYSDARIGRLLSNEVVGMIEKYNKFFFPNFLRPEKE
jgi:ribosomal protein L44E